MQQQSSAPQAGPSSRELAAFPHPWGSAQTAAAHPASRAVASEGPGSSSEVVVVHTPPVLIDLRLRSFHVVEVTGYVDVGVFGMAYRS